MLSKIEIDNFRCFENFTIDKIAPITIIGGSNNSGKSTVLEAILANYVAGNIGVFWSLVNIRNGFVLHPMNPQQVWGPLFCNKADVNELKIASQWNDDKVSEFKLSKIYDSGMQQQANDILSSVQLDFEGEEYNISGKCIIQNDVVQNNRIVFQPANKKDIRRDIFERSFGKCMLYKGMPYDASLPERISKMILDNTKKNLIIQVLQKFDSDIIDVRTVLDNGMSYIYVILKSGEPLAINYMGDGINKALLIISYILSLKNGILLIDEIENGFYYELYRQLFEVFCETALENKCQIIMTTHNLNVIETTMEVMRDFDRFDELCYLRMDVSGKTGRRSVKYFSGEALVSAFESNMEIR